MDVSTLDDRFAGRQGELCVIGHQACAREIDLEGAGLTLEWRPEGIAQGTAQEAT